MKPSGDKNDAELALRLRVTGKVQGVWYRGWLVQQAANAGVRGWVRNRSDRSVEALVVGAAAAVEELVGQCSAGPPTARVVRVDVRPDEDDGSIGFRQLPTQ